MDLRGLIISWYAFLSTLNAAVVDPVRSLGTGLAFRW